MPKKVRIEFSLVAESVDVSDSVIVEDISKTIKNEVTIPWCGKLEEVTISGQ